MTGYLHPEYARALTVAGEPLYLPHAAGWLLRRNIPGSAYLDATGCYPLFACCNWHQLSLDLANQSEEFVSVTIVTDPFGDFQPADLQTAFPDLVRPYKEHFVVDLSAPLFSRLSAHHRRNVRRALSQVEVTLDDSPQALAEWVTLYDHLIRRHAITGTAAFSRESFARQWQVPGMTVFRAVHQSETVGMTLWYSDETHAWYHLGACSPRGYELRAMYALFQRAIEHFASLHIGWLSLGAGAGIENDGQDGLTRFKRGWADATRTAFLCGRILDKKAYEQLTAIRGISDRSFFPAYRHPGEAGGRLLRSNAA